MSYLRNCWYVVAWSSDIKAEIASRKILDTPIVVFRDSNGKVTALADRCAHRQVPLSRGRLVGDLIECGYHGLRYDTSGTCVHVPAQDSIPSRACVRNFPVVERYGWVWVWMGASALASVETIPDFRRLSDPAFAATGATNHVKANYELINDNLLDLSHVGYVHGSTIGTDEFGPKGQLKVERTSHGVRVTRWVIDCAPPPTYCKAGVFKPDDRIDRWQIIDYLPPGFIDIHVGGVLTGTGGPEGRRVGGMGMWVMNAMTPVTATSTDYFWAVGRDFSTDNVQLTGLINREVSMAFAQDKEILEIQQAAMLQSSDQTNVDIIADSGGLQARRVLRRLVAQEHEVAGATAA